MIWEKDQFSLIGMGWFIYKERGACTGKETVSTVLDLKRITSLEMEDAVVEISDKHVIHFKTKGNIFKVPKAFNDLSFMISSFRSFSKNICRHG